MLICSEKKKQVTNSQTQSRLDYGDRILSLIWKKHRRFVLCELARLHSAAAAAVMDHISSPAARGSDLRAL